MEQLLGVTPSGLNKDHDGLVDPAAGGYLSGIGRAVMRLDGFVSAEAEYGGGEIVTPIIRFSGERLELNVDTGGGGSVLVELQDAYGRPISGFASCCHLRLGASTPCSRAVGWA